ncbi:MAG TPA: outer membrane lipoprotein carrier protein LolA [Pyrinomonadaceae bacterium]|nr:outer membrane lipoprotein carrier protein LolA [Pyrinomonadaceae bacterium]
MKRLIPLSLIGMMIVTTFVVFSPTAVHGQGAGLVSAVLNRMEKNRQSLRSLRAGISMEKYNSQLRDSEKFNGVILYEPSGATEASVRIEWRSPQHEILTVSNGKYILFRPRLNMAYTGSSRSSKVNSGSGGLLSLVYMSRRELESRFQPVQDVREETLWGGVSTIHIKLTPKKNEGFKYAEIWVDGGGMPVQTKIVEKNDDATTVRLTGLERNIKISAEEFAIKLDSSVKIVKS